MRDLRPRSKRTIRVSPSHSHPRIKPTRLTTAIHTRFVSIFFPSRLKLTPRVDHLLLHPRRGHPPPVPRVASTPHLHSRSRVVGRQCTHTPPATPPASKLFAIAVSVSAGFSTTCGCALAAAAVVVVDSLIASSIDESRRARPSVRQSHRRGGGFPSRTNRRRRVTLGVKDEVFHFSKRRRQSVTPRAPRRNASGDDGDVIDDTVHVIAVVSLVVVVVENGATRLVYDDADVETTKSKRRHRRRWEEEETPGVVVVGE